MSEYNSIEDDEKNESTDESEENIDFEDSEEFQKGINAPKDK